MRLFCSFSFLLEMSEGDAKTFSGMLNSCLEIAEPLFGMNLSPRLFWPGDIKFTENPPSNSFPSIPSFSSTLELFRSGVLNCALHEVLSSFTISLLRFFLFSLIYFKIIQTNKIKQSLHSSPLSSSDSASLSSPFPAVYRRSSTTGSSVPLDPSKGASSLNHSVCKGISEILQSSG